jgi:hypothetical protein
MKNYEHYKALAMEELKKIHGDSAQLIQAYKDIHTITNSIIMLDLISVVEEKLNKEVAPVVAEAPVVKKAPAKK